VRQGNRVKQPHARRAVASPLLAAGLAIGTVALGCNQRNRTTTEATPDQLTALGMLMPTSVKIQPFTQVKSFDRDPVPDGIEVLVQPLDRLGDPVKVVGRFTFELWTYRPASTDRKDRQIQFWEVVLDDNRDQKRFWDRTAQMYVFPLEVVPGVVPVEEGSLGSGRFVLLAAYHTPEGSHLQDEFHINVREDFRNLSPWLRPATQEQPAR